MTNEMTSHIGSVLLLALALLLAQPVWVRFCEWVKRRLAVVKQCRLRRAAIRTNLSLYKQTGEEYFIDRVKELGWK